MVDLEQFREAMSLFPASVFAVTASSELGEPRGLVATAVCSYTANPPTLLVSISHESRSFRTLQHASHIGIHLLNGNQGNVATALAGKGDDKFSQFSWDWRDNVPTLSSSLLTMIGSVAEHFTYLDHTILFVKLEHLEVEPERDPLIYFKRQMRPLGLLTARTAA